MSTTPTGLVHRAHSLSRAVRSHSPGPVRVRKQSFHGSRAAQAIMMPALSPLMTEGTITRWRKKEGEAFVAGDVLLEIESDIAFLDIRAEMPGILGKILIPDGTTNVPVEQVIALVARDSQELERLRPPTLPKLEVPPSPAQATSVHTPTSAPAFSTSPIAPSPRLPNIPLASGSLHGRRPSLHYHHPLSAASHLEHSTTSLLHSSTHRTPSPFERQHASSLESLQSGAASVRGMVIDHHQLSCPASPSTPCDSTSLVGCGAQAQTQTQAESDGADLRRKIMSSLSRSGSTGSKGLGSKGTTEYFEGIL